MNKIKIAICIPHYGEEAYLLNCLNSIKTNLLDKAKESEYDINVYVYHNTPCNITNNWWGIIKEFTTNVGFTKAINSMVRLLLDKDYKYFWILNNDTEINSNSLESIIKIFENNNSVGIVSNQIRDIKNPDFIHHGGTLAMYPNGVHKTGFASKGELQEDTKEKWVTFASVFISKKCFQEVGMLDENFFNYCSDSDFCLRARMAKFSIIHCAKATILHHIGQSAHPDKIQQKIMFRDIEYFGRKYLNSQLFYELNTGL